MKVDKLMDVAELQNVVVKVESDEKGEKQGGREESSSCSTLFRRWSPFSLQSSLVGAFAAYKDYSQSQSKKEVGYSLVHANPQAWIYL